MTGMRHTLLGVVLLSGGVCALADQPHPRGAPARDVPPHQQADHAPGTGRFDSRDDGQGGRQNAANQAEAERRSGRLSADERRELRRQINEVGQDIYRRQR